MLRRNNLSVSWAIGSVLVLFTWSKIWGNADMCTLMQKDVLIENLAETSAFIGMRFKGVEHIPLEFSMCGLLMYFILPHDALSQQKHLLLMQITLKTGFMVCHRLWLSLKIESFSRAIVFTAGCILPVCSLIRMGAWPELPCFSAEILHSRPENP